MATEVMRPQTTSHRPAGVAAAGGIAQTLAATTGARQLRLTSAIASVAGGPALEQLKRSAGACISTEHAQHGGGTCIFCQPASHAQSRLVTLSCLPNRRLTGSSTQICSHFMAQTSRTSRGCSLPCRPDDGGAAIGQARGPGSGEHSTHAGHRRSFCLHVQTCSLWSHMAVSRNTTTPMTSLTMSLNICENIMLISAFACTAQEAQGRAGALQHARCREAARRHGEPQLTRQDRRR